MIEIKVKDALIELKLMSSIERHEKLDERLRDFQALFTPEEFLEIFGEMKRVKDEIDPSDLLKHGALLRDLKKLKRLNTELTQKEIKFLNKEQRKKEVGNDYKVR